MKAVSQQLLDLLENTLTGSIFTIDLFRFDLAGGGAPLMYCSGDQDVTASGLLYRSGGVFSGVAGTGGPFFNTEGNSVTLHSKIGLEVDSLTLDVIPGNATISGVPFLTACRQRLFDGATCTIERAYMPSYGDTSAGTITIFKGRVGGIAVGRSIATFSINSSLELLNIELPRNVWQPGCSNTLGDFMCGVNLNNYSVNLVAATSTASQVNATFTTQFAGYYDLGRVVFTSGTLSGESRPVQTAVAGSPGYIVLVAPLLAAPVAGDAFTLFPGCSKSYTNLQGCTKFSNVARFRGEPAVPNPAVAL